MTRAHDNLDEFRMAYLDYLEATVTTARGRQPARRGSPSCGGVHRVDNRSSWCRPVRV